MEYDEDEGGKPVKTEHWEPPDWKKQLGYIREMRSGRDAPVDSMGAEKCYDPAAPAHVGVFEVNCARPTSLNALTFLLVVSSFGTGGAFPGVGVSHAVQSDEGPGDGSGHAEASSSRLHCGKYTGY